MKEPETTNLPAISTGRGVDRPKTGGELIIDTLVGDAWATALQQIKPTFRIGNYELHEEAYRQILIWAEVEGREPEWIIQTASNLCRINSLQMFKNGQIASLCISDELMSKTEVDLSSVPALIELSCEAMNIAKLDLSGVPALSVLSCQRNQLIELDLSRVPELTKFNCRENQLTELDLSAMPLLSELSCQGNQLIELDLSSVPKLTLLRCDANQLTQLYSTLA